MFGPRINPFSFTKILGGLSKTLNVVNQAIPLYNQITPMISNARKAINLVKEFSNTSVNKAITNINDNVRPNIPKNLTIENKNRPTFFQ